MILKFKPLNLTQRNLQSRLAIDFQHLTFYLTPKPLKFVTKFFTKYVSEKTSILDFL